MQRLLVVLLSILCGGLGYVIGSRSANCRYVVTPRAQFIHLETHSIVILSADFIDEAFGAHGRELTIFYGSNRLLTESGTGAIVRAPLLPTSKAVRALYFSGDAWSDLVAPLYALETKEMVLLRLNLQTHEVELGERRKLTDVDLSVTPEGILLLKTR